MATKSTTMMSDEEKKQSLWKRLKELEAENPMPYERMEEIDTRFWKRLREQEARKESNQQK